MWRYIIISLWLLGSLYFGIGGFVSLKLDISREHAEVAPKKEVKYGRINVRNIEMRKVLENEKKALTFFRPILTYFPTYLELLITSIAFGIIGSIIRTLKEISLKQKKIDEIDTFVSPVLGGLIGIIVLGIAYLLPSVLVENDVNVDPFALLFFSLFGGFSTEKFFSWFSGVINKVFS